MKQNAVEFAERYAGAVRRFLKRGARATLKPALILGSQAAALGMEALEMARIHDQTLLTLKLAADGRGRGLVRRAESFFSEAIIPIIETHSAAVQTRSDLSCLNQTLARRTVELAVSHRRLRVGIVRRKTVETALKTSGEHYARLLKESLQLQEELRRLTHKVLAAQENERLKLSQKLQNEVAQTLLGINVRLVAIKRESRNRISSVRDEIDQTHRLVAQSARSITRVIKSLQPS